MKQSDRLLHILREFDDFLVVMHDNPDPDAIAAASGIHTLIRERPGKSARVVGAGAIVRAENCQMVKLLCSPIKPIGQQVLLRRLENEERTEGISALEN